jgi:RNase P subunit RPR2
MLATCQHCDSPLVCAPTAGTAQCGCGGLEKEINGVDADYWTEDSAQSITQRDRIKLALFFSFCFHAVCRKLFWALENCGALYQRTVCTHVHGPTCLAGGSATDYSQKKKAKSDCTQDHLSSRARCAHP